MSAFAWIVASGPFFSDFLWPGLLFLLMVIGFAVFRLGETAFFDKGNGRAAKCFGGLVMVVGFCMMAPCLGSIVWAVLENVLSQ